MGPITYSIILLLVFLAGIFVFTYFETPRKTLDRGIRSFNKGMKKMKIHILNVNKSANKPLILPGENKRSVKGDDELEVRVYVHEY